MIIDKLKDEEKQPSEIGCIAIKIKEGKHWYMYKALGYEIFKKGKLVQRVDWSSGKPIPIEGHFKEHYPSSEEFGKDGTRCYKNYDLALEYFNKVEREANA